MNRSQKVVLAFFIVVAVVIVLYPPWDGIGLRQFDIAFGVRRSIGHHFLWSHQEYGGTTPDDALDAAALRWQASHAQAGAAPISDTSKFPGVPLGDEHQFLLARIDMTELTIEWVTLVLVAAGLLLLFKSPAQK